MSFQNVLMCPVKATCVSSCYDTLLGLSGQLWPVHLQPKEDELLSSWIIRLAHAHGYKVQTMCSMLLGSDAAIWNRDIDQLAPNEDLQRLSTISGASAERIEQTTLRSLEGILFEKHTPNGICRWIVPIGVFHRSRRRPGLMFCPECLKEDPEPYFRKTWRLAFATICAEHACYLLDVCPNCHSPLAPHRSDMQSRTVFPKAGLNACCWKCGFDYRKTIEQPHLLEESHVRFQEKLEHALKNGYVEWANSPNMHSLVFFEGLRVLIAGLTSRQTRNRLKRSTNISVAELSDFPKNGFEFANLPSRRELFSILAKVTERWPESFVDLIHECDLRYADLKGDGLRRPYWYEDVIHLEASARRIATSDAEFNSISNAVIARNVKFSAFKAKLLFDRKLHWQPVTSVSDEIYDELLISIDHEIARTLDSKDRAVLIRDKIMFAVGRVLKLSQNELACLTLDKVRQRVTNTEVADFYNNAKTPAQAKAWVEWYWENIRHQLEPSESVGHVFTSIQSKKGLRRSAVGYRFRRAVDAAMLTREIAEYGAWVK
ncbi:MULTISPECIES: TniQ family protein [Methylomonas]